MSNNRVIITQADVTDECEKYRISYREPTPPPVGRTLFFFWWCPSEGCHNQRYRLDTTRTCLKCSKRFVVREGASRSLWFYVDESGRRTRFVWNQRFRRPDWQEAAAGLWAVDPAAAAAALDERARQEEEALKRAVAAAREERDEIERAARVVSVAEGHEEDVEGVEDVEEVEEVVVGMMEKGEVASKVPPADRRDPRYPYKLVNH